MLIVTGAGGWIGGRLVDRARAAGREVRPVRAAELAAGDAGPMRGAAVVHLAGIAHRSVAPADRALYAEVNRDLAMACARAAAAAGARRFVFASTAAVMGVASPGRPWTESDVTDPRDPYSVSKREAEQGLAALYAAGSIETVVLRPPLVWGVGARANFLAMLRWACSPWPLPLGAATAPRSMLHLDHAVSALLHLADAPGVAGRVLFARDDVDRSVAGWIGAIRGLEGRPARLVGVPGPIVRALAVTAGRPGIHQRLYSEFRVDDAALRASGWAPSVPFETSLRETVAWFRRVRA